ncbi:MAG: hypothetical protein QNJ22_01100 [Desulfosarcinaceae bacterium]|nr:hypothetical protein [Desulfosarcinaceae bacterium]
MASTAGPTPAATLVLVRQNDSGLAVYLLQRSLQSRFMAGSYVFPGGKIDREDRDIPFWLGRGDLDREALALRFHDAPEQLSLLPYAVAAIRESWEEAGVLLARFSGDDAQALDAMQALRKGTFQPNSWLRRQLIARQGTLSFSDLWPWSHWIAPEALPERYDTRFFIAFMPFGQRCRPDPRETPQGGWMTPCDALTGNADKRLKLSPPTLVTLQGLLAYHAIDDLRAALPRSGWGPPLLPKMVFPAVGAMVIQPWDPAYAAPEKRLPKRRVQLEVLPVGAPFSRLWNDDGTWRPVA